MTPEDAKALKIAAATIRTAEQPALALAFEGRGYLDRIRALKIDEQKKAARLAAARDGIRSCRQALTTFASRSCRELLTARYIVEAATASGHDLPALALELRDLLEKIGRPAWLDFISTIDAAGWLESAAAIKAAASHGEKATRTAQIPASTPAAAPTIIHTLRARVEARELPRIFADLVEARFIAGVDAAGASMRQPFLDVFDPEAREQGRIIWTGTPLRGGAAGRPSPTQALDFVALMAGGLSGITPAFARDTFPAIFPGLSFSKTTFSRFAYSWNRSDGGRGSEFHSTLARIVNATK